MSPEQIPEELLRKIADLSEEFDIVCQNRHDIGGQKYGQGTWLRVDTIQHALDELADMANYIRYTYVKLRLIQEMYGDGETATPIPGNEMLGKTTAPDPVMEGFFNPYRRGNASRANPS